MFLGQGMKKKIIIGLLLFICIILSAAWYYRRDLKRIMPHIIAEMPNKTTRGILVELLNDSDEEVVMDAAYYLGVMGDSTAYLPLIKAINHPVPMVRHNAINAMIRLNQADLAAEATIKNIRNKNEEGFVLDSAMSLLRQLQDADNQEEAVRVLREYAPRAKHTWDRGEAEEIIRMFEKARASEKSNKENDAN
jgi:HEAT repeat protein